MSLSDNPPFTKPMSVGDTYAAVLVRLSDSALASFEKLQTLSLAILAATKVVKKVSREDSITQVQQHTPVLC
jgi:hypothetical protein